ncbi:thiosulfate sulfurtransferase [Scytonema sp. HK-05]|uniref:sulfurtransferase n=1 Tax=Scytonema sp. HK-05 TaxID=1137095 RepID=UPI000936BE45|nr:rhodanese-like domain-containing protein [Scytonema sp. HK-05]OKH59904.1 thiosulfate sulfurtransferase [Scytonema sp. HK-05]BAY43015.1 thiosulfate sulfurtransferase [Scytonema sp. HK-05]
MQWIVNADEAKQLISQGATILDTRNKLAWLISHIPGAVHVTWQQFSNNQKPYRGKLLADANLLEQKLRQVGIFHSKPVIVLGNPPDNFGEEGRIVWMLRTLGHQSAALVDGGYNALVKAGVPTTRGLNQPLEIGDFVVNRTALWEIQRDELQVNLSENKMAVIDTRQKREYAGETPYGEQRGGHIPGAVHFYFKDLMDTKGNLLKPEEIIAKLETLGIQRDTPTVTYCTGGIRSAFFVAVLVNLGFSNVKNYAGSMWEWSASPDEKYPLE